MKLKYKHIKENNDETKIYLNFRFSCFSVSEDSKFWNIYPENLALSFPTDLPFYDEPFDSTSEDLYDTEMMEEEVKNFYKNTLRKELSSFNEIKSVSLGNPEIDYVKHQVYSGSVEISCILFEGFNSLTKEHLDYLENYRGSIEKPFFDVNTYAFNELFDPMNDWDFINDFIENWLDNGFSEPESYQTEEFYNSLSEDQIQEIFMDILGCPKELFLKYFTVNSTSDYNSYKDLAIALASSEVELKNDSYKGLLKIKLYGLDNE